MSGGQDEPRRAWVDHVMGMPVSVHVRGDDAHAAATERAVRAAFAELREVDRVLSTYRPDSDVSRYARGELPLADCDARVREVHRLCLLVLATTDGAVDAWGWSRRGFDPTGVVKGWAVERALDALGGVRGDVAIDAGGDVAVRCDPAGPGWLVGVEHPDRPGELLATVRVHAGGVATSGTAARGAHVVDPGTGLPAAHGVRSATVVGPSPCWADVWATAVMVTGRRGPGGTGGLVLHDDGGTWGWHDGAARPEPGGALTAVE
ncbi:FAD:protein FMN transferase [Cellulomonas massiliensis]|uniref:FAD:protein FMN transferase n=1 Tax=Cellulomonas massiliensis TaxID=1465811 RepID=UPI000307037E|nr:FAD:protein FMN transferase [Cellulomonas massiliensis]